MNEKQFTLRMKYLRHSLNITVKSMKNSVNDYVSDSNNENLDKIEIVLQEVDNILQEIDFHSYLLFNKIKKLKTK